jgi:hypothetical protein
MRSAAEYAIILELCCQISYIYDYITLIYKGEAASCRLKLPVHQIDGAHGQRDLTGRGFFGQRAVS